MTSVPGHPDLAGLTHVGKVRTENQDHFLACALDREERVRASSLPEPPPEWGPLSEDLAGRPGGIVVAAVADGVGGGPAGERASRQALLAFPSRLSASLLDDREPREMRGRLATATLEVHRALLDTADRERALVGMATTFTAWIGMGAEAWILQVGDSRCYRLREGRLEQLTRDQTMAQDLVDQGLIGDLHQAPLGWDNILTGALGGVSAEPAVVHADRRAGDVLLVCSDGVMKHVSDGEIAGILAEATSAREAAETLVDRALAGGGTDNVTAVVVRELP